MPQQEKITEKDILQLRSQSPLVMWKRVVTVAVAAHQHVFLIAKSSAIYFLYFEQKDCSMSLHNGQKIKLKSILHLKALFIGFIMTFNLGVTAAHAQPYQTHWFSEEKAESGENEAQCNGGISAIECDGGNCDNCLLYTSPSPRDATLSRMPSSA